MPTTAPDVTIDAIVGQQVIASTATPAAAATPTGLPQAVATPQTSAAPGKKYTSKPLSIYGYAPAGSVVKLNGIGVSGQVVAETNGFFRFNSIYSYSSLYPEICLQAQDAEKRTTQPVCIPPIPQEKIIPLEVGPVLLSPTLSLSKNNITKGEQSVASGYSAPNSKITIYLAKQTKKVALISEAQAYYLPEYEVVSDGQGYYEFVLPSNSVSSYRLFASGRVGDAPSSKSNTLNFKVLPKIVSWWQFLYELLFKSSMRILLLIELIIIIFMGYLLSKPTTKDQKSSKNIKAIKTSAVKHKPASSLAEVQKKYQQLLESKKKSV